MSAIATHWLIFYMLLSSVHYNSKLNYKSHLLPMSRHHKLSPALCLARLRCLCKASRAPEKTVQREVPVCFSLNYGLVTSTIYIRPREKWGVCSTIKESKTQHPGPTWEPAWRNHMLSQNICRLFSSDKEVHAAQRPLQGKADGRRWTAAIWKRELPVDLTA